MKLSNLFTNSRFGQHLSDFEQPEGPELEDVTIYGGEPNEALRPAASYLSEEARKLLTTQHRDDVVSRIPKGAQ